MAFRLAPSYGGVLVFSHHGCIDAVCSGISDVPHCPAISSFIYLSQWMWWPPSVVVVVRRPSQSERLVFISRTVWPRTTQCYRDIHADLLPTVQPHRIWRYRRLQVGIRSLEIKRSKMPASTALGRMLVAWRFARHNQLAGFLFDLFYYVLLADCQTTSGFFWVSK